MAPLGNNRWLWPFELDEKLGEGAMGLVYRARCVTNDKMVAVKILPDEFTKNKVLAARFQRETKVLKTLRHPNIVHCFGGTCKGRQFFYAMEIVDGGSLQEMIRKRGRLTWKEAVTYALQIAAGLGFAHERGIVHRDVKPANFLLTRNGDLKLSDFGLAHVSSETKLTTAGMTMGTISYMSPEQVRASKDIGPPTDVYAAGCVFFEMLTGWAPFRGGQAAEIMQQHLSADPPRVTKIVPDCPPEADMLVKACMTKSAADRISDGNAMAEWIRRNFDLKLLGIDTDAHIDNSETVSVINVAGGKTLARTKGKTAGPSLRIQTKVPLSVRLRDLRMRLRLRSTWYRLGFVGLLIASVLLNIVFLTRDSADAPESEGARPVVQSGSSRGVEMWIEALSHENSEEVRIAAIHAVAELAHDQDTALDALIDLLGDRRATIRFYVIDTLGGLGARALPAMRKLENIRRTDSDRVVRSAAQSVARQIRAATARLKNRRNAAGLSCSGTAVIRSAPVAQLPQHRARSYFAVSPA